MDSQAKKGKKSGKVIYLKTATFRDYMGPQVSGKTTGVVFDGKSVAGLKNCGWAL